MARTSIVLAVVAALLGGYILLFERGSISSGEREARKGSALPEFVRARVSKLEIQRKGVTIVVARDPDAAPEDEASEWRVESPYRAKADQEAVDTLLGELEWLDGRHRLEGIDASDRKRFGFDAPRYRLWFTVGKHRIPLLVGNRSAREDGVYVSGPEPDQAFVVGKELVETLDQEPGHYHTKELYDDVLVALSVGLALRDGEGERAMRKREDGLWEFERGGDGLASQPAIRSVIEVLKGLRARRFVAQDVKELGRYGLEQPRLAVTLDQNRFGDKKDDKGKPLRERVSLRLRAGAPCDGHAGESYFTVEGSGRVFCVADEDVQKLQKPLAELREERLLPLEDDEISALQVTSGNAKVVVRKSGESWSYEASGTAGGAQKGDARSEAVSDWIKGLRAQKALRFLPRAAAPSPGKSGFALRAERGEGKPAYAVYVASAGPGELIAQRSDEPQAIALAESALELLEPSAARFRKLALRSDAAATPQRIEIRRGAEVERLERAADGHGFAVTSPVTAQADPVTGSELARLLGSLEAVRFVADAAQPRHGLGDPALQISATYAAAPEAKPGEKPPAALGLRIGAATEGGRFASVEGDPAVFVVSSQLVDLASAPLVSRTSLATPLERLRSAEFDRAGRRVRIEASGGSFVAAKETPLPSGAAEQLAQTLATLRASRTVGYGPPAREQGFDKPALRVEIKADRAGGGQQDFTLLLGAEADGGRYARRSDLPATFVLPKDSADALLAQPGS